MWWYKLLRHSDGSIHLSEKPLALPGKGVAIAQEQLDRHTTIEYIAVHGNVIVAKECYTARERRNVRDRARMLYKCNEEKRNEDDRPTGETNSLQNNR